MATIYDFTGSYGQDWAHGLLIDAVQAAADAGMRVVSTAGGAWVYDGRYPAARVVCGDFVEVATEDGPITGRCGAPVASLDAGACPGHADLRDVWLDLSEAEKAAVERREDEEAWA